MAFEIQAPSTFNKHSAELQPLTSSARRTRYRWDDIQYHAINKNRKNPKSVIYGILEKREDVRIKQMGDFGRSMGDSRKEANLAMGDFRNVAVSSDDHGNEERVGEGHDSTGTLARSCTDVIHEDK